MPLVHWDFFITGESGVKNIKNYQKLRPQSRGIYAASAEEVEELAAVSGFEAPGWDRDGYKFRKIDVKEPEGSERLKKLLAAIKGKYGFVPSGHKVVPVADRDHVFGLRKVRKYTTEEIDSWELLYISVVGKTIAEHKEGTPDQVEAEQYVVERHRKKKTVPFGMLMPFHAKAVTGELKDQLEDAGLAGVEFEPVINGDDIWKLGSSLRMPRCLLPLIDQSGAEVEPDVWPTRFSGKYFDDRGYEPPELTYDKNEVAKLGIFDIAMTAERIYGSKSSSSRFLVVSQRFREVLNQLKVSAVHYAPVHLI